MDSDKSGPSWCENNRLAPGIAVLHLLGTAFEDADDARDRGLEIDAPETGHVGAAARARIEQAHARVGLMKCHQPLWCSGRLRATLSLFSRQSDCNVCSGSVKTLALGRRTRYHRWVSGGTKICPRATVRQRNHSPLELLINT
jgi:hypothetical protein